MLLRPDNEKLIQQKISHYMYTVYMYLYSQFMLLIAESKSMQLKVIIA